MWNNQKLAILNENKNQIRKVQKITISRPTENLHRVLLLKKNKKLFNLVDQIHIGLKKKLQAKMIFQ